jgi:hypothetical protein
MDYTDAVASFAAPLPEPAPVPIPTIDASPARRLRDAIEPLAMHPVWSKTTNERLASLGLNFLTGYVWGRAAALGDPTPGVVVSAFAVFQPDLVRETYTAGRTACARDDLVAARTESTTASLAAVLADEDPTEIARVATALRTAARRPHHAGKPLYSGLRDQQWPEDPVGVLWRSCELAREHRGDSHVAVSVAEGLDPVEMNLLTELFVGMPLGTYSASRGWSSDELAAAADRLRASGRLDGDALTTAGQTHRAAIEARTDALDQPIIEGLGADLDDTIGLLDRWSQRCIDAGAFPPDPYKRAAG